MITTDTLHLGDCLELMKDIPDNSIVAGNPARIIGNYLDFAQKRVQF